jgi:hypothetical protein
VVGVGEPALDVERVGERHEHGLLLCLGGRVREKRTKWARG